LQFLAKSLGPGLAGWHVWLRWLGLVVGKCALLSLAGSGVDVWKTVNSLLAGSLEHNAGLDGLAAMSGRHVWT
jgi:hypothetical protein